MANLLYPKFKEALLRGEGNLEDGTVMVALIDLGTYTYSAAHDTLDDVPAAARIGEPQPLTSKTISNGVFDAANVTIPPVTGPTVEAVLFFIAESGLLVGLFDEGVSLPVTPNGGPINLNFNANGIFGL